MKKGLWQFMLFLAITAAAMPACKNKSKENTTTTQDTGVYTNTPPQISDDESLKNGVRDATKDFPGVTATVNNGEVTLTGEINREDLQRLMPTIQSLNPRRVNNQLTVK